LLPVVAPDEPVAEIIMHGGPQFAKSCLTGCQGLFSSPQGIADILPINYRLWGGGTDSLPPTIRLPPSL
jgi:hypothetical protein